MADPNGTRQSVAVTRLVTAMAGLELDGEVSLAGRWITIRGERGLVHVMEIPWRGGYSTWCDLAGARTVERYDDATDAIQAGLRRAARRT